MSKAKEKKPSKFSSKKRAVIITGLSFLVIFSLVGLFLLIFLNRVYPGISIAGVKVTALTQAEAKDKIIRTIKNRQKQTLIFSHNNQQFVIALNDAVEDYGVQNSLNQAFEYGRIKTYLKPISLSPEIKLSSEIDSQIKPIAQAVNIVPLNAQLKVEEAEITVTPSQDGLVVDIDELKKLITRYLLTGEQPDKDLPIKKAYPELSYETALGIKNRLDQIKLEPLKLSFKGQTFIWDLTTVLELLDLENSENSLASTNFTGEEINLFSIKIGSTEYTDTTITLDKEAIKRYLTDIALQINRPVREPLFEFDPNAPARIKEFQPPQDGQRLNLEEAEYRITQAMLTPNQKIIELPVDITKPKNKLSNEMGINELVGSGVSNFAGSIPNRAYNVNYGATKINGVIIPPGEVFSFNNTVGDITAATGFKQAYVIKSGRTVLDDGGGICQVSTTLYRAVLNAGLPVVKRTAHAYRVGYYEQGSPVGLDATIYYPSVDFQFKNDTGHHILIQSYVVGSNLHVDFYGTSDGRVVKMTTPKILTQTPPLPEIRQDDPTLPKGTVKQVDWAAWGANVVFTRNVTRNGETLINETVRSNYRPWQAVYLVGTGG